MLIGVLSLVVGGLLIFGAATWAVRRLIEERRAPVTDLVPPRTDPAPPPAPAPAPPTAQRDINSETPPDVPTFSVVALGLIGAGKTVMLASQARELRPADRRRFHLDCGLTQHRILADLHSQVLDTSAPWPPATLLSDENEFRFDCMTTDDRHRQHTVFRIHYFDYPGEELTPGAVTGSPSDIESRIAGAHALFVMLDGQRVLGLLDGNPSAHGEFEDQIWPMIALAHRAQCPVQLIVTKWDLVQSFGPRGDDDELLQKIWEQLQRHPVVTELVHAHCERKEQVRLIPVSAVGLNFAKLRADGTVIKRPDGVLKPMNVEVPLCAVIPDLLTQLEQSLAPSDRQELADEIDRVPVGSVSTMAQSVLSSRIGVLNALAVLASDVVLRLFLEKLARGSRRPEQPPTDDGEGELARLRLDVIEDMTQIITDFEARWRSSRLCARRRSQ